jgi:hypothetical protein
VDRVRSETLHLWNVYLEAIYVYERSMPRRETCISRWHASLSIVLLIFVYLTGVYLIGMCFTERASQRCTSHGTGASPRVCPSHGRVSFAGMHLKSLHLIGAYISQDVRLRCVYLMGVALSQACIAVPKPLYPNCVPGR